MLSDVVGERIMTWRKRRGLNREALAERCAKLGLNLTAESFTNIESGRRRDGVRRRTITVDELLAIARALDVPPMLLLVPYPEQQTVEMIPGWELPTALAVEWMSGTATEGPEATEPGAGQSEWVAAAKPLLLLRVYRRAIDAYADLLDELGTARMRAGRAAYQVDKASVSGGQALENARLLLDLEQKNAERIEERVFQAQQGVVDLRATMTAEDCPPPTERDGLIPELEGSAREWTWAFTHTSEPFVFECRIFIDYHRERKEQQ